MFVSERTKSEVGFLACWESVKFCPTNHMVFIELRQVILFPYIIGGFQKKLWFLNSRIAGRGVKISHSASVSDRKCRTGHFFPRGKITKNNIISE